MCSAFTVMSEVPFFSSGSNVVTLGCAELRNIISKMYNLYPA